MKNDQEKINIEESVLEKIQNGEVKMVPKSHFILKRIVLILFTLTILFFSIVLVSFLVFSLTNSGNLFLLGFGKKGIYKFLLIFPWYLMLTTAFLLFFLDFLLRKFKYGYNSPLVYLFLGSLVLVTVFSFLVNYSRFHSRFSQYAKSRDIPFAKDVYDRFRVTSYRNGAFRGIVTKISGSYITVKPLESDLVGEKVELKIHIPNGDKIGDFIKIGEEIYIAGDIATGTEIISYGIQKMTRPNW